VLKIYTYTNNQLELVGSSLLEGNKDRHYLTSFKFILGGIELGPAKGLEVQYYLHGVHNNFNATAVISTIYYEFKKNTTKIQLF